MISRNCLVCGIKFSAVGKWKTCSRACSDEQVRRRHRASDKKRQGKRRGYHNKLCARRNREKWAKRPPRKCRSCSNEFIQPFGKGAVAFCGDDCRKSWIYRLARESYRRNSVNRRAQARNYYWENHQYKLDEARKYRILHRQVHARKVNEYARKGRIALRILRELGINIEV